MRNLLLIFVLLASCNNKEKLPILGPFERVAGEKRYHPVSDFELTDQYGRPFNQDSLMDKIRVVDFFFTSCPSICPKVQAQMLKIYETFTGIENLTLLSHTIDPKRDNVEKLRHYAHNLGIDEPAKWYFLTGDKDELYDLAGDYFNIVVEDESAPGGFDHSGRIVLVDEAGYIRSYANGLDPAAVDTLISDIWQLLDKQ